MAEEGLTDEGAKGLIAVEKWRSDEEQAYFPVPGSRVEKGLVSSDFKHRFILTVNRSNKRNPAKITYQLRTASADILLRLDIEGPAHGNPDGTLIPCPHLHIYKQGYGDRWAYAIPEHLARNLPDLFEVLADFYLYCNVTQPPLIIRGLFS